MPPRQFATMWLGVPEADAQGLDDFFRDLCGSICGCGDDERRRRLNNKMMVAARQNWPNAGEECLSRSISGIITAFSNSIGLLFSQGPAQFLAKLVTEIAAPLSDFIGCVFGDGPKARFDSYAGVAVPVSGWMARFAIPPGLLQCLLPCLLQLMCPPGLPTGPTPRAVDWTGCCPPGDGPTDPPPDTGEWKPATGKR